MLISARKYTFLAMLVSLAGLATSGCEDATYDSIDDPWAARAFTYVQRALTDARPEVTKFNYPNQPDHCSAVFISPTYLLTAAHCVDFLPHTTKYGSV
ncbi:MAG: hypothetical protein MUC50_05545, partial [Myxococcota bacterium]|nr:hypothetical protein [Myxococcota bacterium]